MVSTRHAATLLTTLERYPTRTQKLKTVMKVDNVISYLKKKKVEKNWITNTTTHIYLLSLKKILSGTSKRM